MASRQTALLALLRGDLPSFIAKCFSALEPGGSYRENWHIHHIAHQLTRVSDGEIKRLIVNIPPRHLKSICVSVAYTAWVMGHDPSLKVIALSYGSELAEELARHFRTVVESDWYRAAFPEFRRKLMANHPKHLAVLEAVAERTGWGAPPPEGIHRGLAQTMGFGSYVAACAEVSVSPEGELKIHRIVAATDPGHAVNPQQIEAQVEGSFVYGLSAMLYGECTVAGGRMEQENLDTYQVMRINEMPVVETIVMPSGGFWGGVGEPTIAVAAPAVLNAIFAATGKRIRQLPIKHHDLSSA